MKRGCVIPDFTYAAPSRRRQMLEDVCADAVKVSPDVKIGVPQDPNPQRTKIPVPFPVSLRSLRIIML